MAKYQVFPDLCVSMNRILGDKDRGKNKDRYKESLELFDLLEKNPGTCVMTPNTLRGISMTLQRPPYCMARREAVQKMQYLRGVSTIKSLDIAKERAEELSVKEFYNDFLNSEKKGYIDIGQVAKRYRGLMKDLKSEYPIMVFLPGKEDIVFLAEAICLSDGCDNNYVPSYDHDLINDDVSVGLEDEFGIITGRPADILKKIRQH
jgi:hypothetical protein